MRSCACLSMSGKVGVQPAACEQGYVGGSAVLFQTPQVPLPPYAYRLFFFVWHGKAGEKIIPLLFISAAQLFKD